jgi:hypothetical protein
MILTGENRRTRIRTCHGATLSTINPTWTGLGSEKMQNFKNSFVNDQPASSDRFAVQRLTGATNVMIYDMIYMIYMIRYDIWYDMI